MNSLTHKDWEEVLKSAEQTEKKLELDTLINRNILELARKTIDIMDYELNRKGGKK